MSKLLITRGLPGSGKSFGAVGWAETENNCGRPSVVIGRDHIRLDILKLGTTLGTSAQEDLVTKMQRTMVEQALCSGWQVCVDDTNLPQKRARDWADLAAQCHAEFGVINYALVPLDVCLRNNEQRYGTVKYVPPGVIKTMHAKYLAQGRFIAEVAATPAPEAPQTYIPPPFDAALPETYIFDIDGTLAKMHNRGPFEWHKVGQDHPHHWVMDIADGLKEAGYTIICLSGRDESCREQTETWLKKWSVPYTALYMRGANDNRKDSIIKAELFFDHIAPKYRVMAVFDDRDQVVKAWREMGVNCCQVNYGNF